jgi:hypothetical protein
MPELFDLSPSSVGDFLSRDIRLPRFQRKSTWTQETRFQLALSLFKGYPLGTVVVKAGARTVQGVDVPTTYLLDGRQRRETFERLVNPEELWRWAAVALKLRANTPDAVVVERFLEYVNDYFFGLEDWQQEPLHEDQISAAAPEEEHPEDDRTGEASTGDSDPDQDRSSQPVTESTPAAGDLALATQVILAVHPIREAGRRSRLRDPFDFSRFVDQLEYLDRDSSGRRFVNIDSLLNWVTYRRSQSRLREGDSGSLTEDAFIGWLTDGREVSNIDGLRQLVTERWPSLERTLALIQSLEAKVRSSTIGLIEIRGKATPEDEKKIFEIINTAGAKLTAAEILSATPAWNVEVNAPPIVVANTRELFAQLKVEFQEPVRRWDVAATLLDRVVPHSELVFGPARIWPWKDIKAKQFERKVTLGFQVLSGYYQRRLSKSHIADLTAVSSVRWDTLELEASIEAAMRRLRDTWFFTYLDAWRFSFAQFMSDAIALDFLLETVFDWEQKGSPAAGAALNLFRKNGIIRFDRLVYEYLTDQWRGSSDSRIARNLQTIASRQHDGVEAQIRVDDWESLVNEVRGGELGGRSYLDRLDPRMRLLLTYAMVILQLRPDDANEAIEVDHIIPQRLFSEGVDRALRSQVHHLGNLQLLPRSLNAFKSDRRLAEITDVNVMDGVEKFSRVRRADFSFYSSVQGVPELKARRGSLLAEVLGANRIQVIEDPDAYRQPSLWVKSQD